MPHFVPTQGRSLPGALPWPAQPGLAWPFKVDLAGPQFRMTRGEGGGGHVGRGTRAARLWVQGSPRQRTSGITISRPSSLQHDFRLVLCHQVRLHLVRLSWAPVWRALKTWLPLSSGLLPNSTRAWAEGSPPPTARRYSQAVSSLSWASSPVNLVLEKPKLGCVQKVPVGSDSFPFLQVPLDAPGWGYLRAPRGGHGWRDSRGEGESCAPARCARWVRLGWCSGLRCATGTQEVRGDG